MHDYNILLNLDDFESIIEACNATVAMLAREMGPDSGFECKYLTLKKKFEDLKQAIEYQENKDFALKEFECNPEELKQFVQHYISDVNKETTI